jgi:hypothetical protein
VATEQAAIAASVYGDYIKDELARQEQRKGSFEQRGLAVVSTAGALVTLLLGAAALSEKEVSLLTEERVWLAAALALFIVSATFALATNFPLKYKGLDISDLLDRLNADPEDTPDDATYAVADGRARILQAAQERNTLKGYLLFAALLIEVGAVTCIGIAIIEVLHPL